MQIRPATKSDLTAIAEIYSDIHSAEEQGKVTIGWQRGIYPTLETAKNSLERKDLFVEEDEDKIVGTGIINQQQVDVYKEAKWQYPAEDRDVMVLHTLVISTTTSRKGYGRSFVKFYEEYAASKSCKYLRMDTNIINVNARALYKKLGYAEVDIRPCIFNGLKDVKLVLLEKKL